ncbi:MAG TPA: MG2 domain-containing protein, partial [Myxococcota bacterium]|nr:MG2 domain-containing protein [Myxococcota bacterium]
MNAVRGGVGVWTVGLLLACGAAWAQPAEAPAPYQPGDLGQRPQARGVSVLPERYLRGFDPITVYFPDDRGPGRGPADDGAARLSIQPAWPGAWSWLDRRTLQFRPAEPWPALARFLVKAGGQSQVLTTMMSAPSAMTPPADSDELLPFRSLTLTFPAPLELAALKKMLRLEVRDQPGLADSPRRVVEAFSLALLPRQNHREPAAYAVTLDQEVPEGKLLLVQVSLALGEEDKVLWTGRLATRLPFHLSAIQCGGAQLPLRGSAKAPRDMALACGSGGETPQLVFSAPVGELGLSALKKLVRFEPAVEGLRHEVFGKRVVLKGKFVPDLIYRLSLRPAPLVDDAGRGLQDPGEVEAFFYLGWRQPYVRWEQGSAILEAQGPRMIPLAGYGEPRADLRIYRIDPLHDGLWPFPASPVTVAEEAPPPFPGEEPARDVWDFGTVDAGTLVQHVRLLGSPLVSRVVDLPLADRGAAAHFGLDVGPLLDAAVGARRPGHYLVGLRRLQGPPERSYVRVQVTNLSLTSVEERERVVFYVRSLDEARPVRGAEVLLEVVREPPPPTQAGQRRQPPREELVRLATDAEGRAVLARQAPWRQVRRVWVKSGEDVLVIDPRDPPPHFANNHWSFWGSWLQWITQDPPAPPNDRLVGFLFSERPIYRPGEKVYLKGFARRKVQGQYRDPGAEDGFAVRIQAPGGKQWLRPVKFSPLRGFDLVFEEADAPTGEYTASLLLKASNDVLATRSFKVEAYRIPTFEVQMVGPNRVPNDQPFQVKALARYYAGGSVSGQPIDWTVTRQPLYHVPKGMDGYLFASSLQFSREGQARPPETIREQRELGENGSDPMQVNPALDLDGSPRLYRFEATVTGADNQIVSAVHEVRALPPFVVGMKLTRYLKDPGQLKPEVVAIGVDDKPLAGQKVKLRLSRRAWHSHLRETDFSTGQAAYVTEQEDKLLQELELTTGPQPVVQALKLEQAGVYLVELVARDRLGRVQSLEADVFVGGTQALAWEKPSQGVFELGTDKERYRPGEVAQLVLKSPFQRAQALVILEDPAGVRHEWLQVEGGKAVHPVRVGEHMAPNLPLHVLLMRGRLGDGGAEGDARYRPETLGASL